MSSIKKRKLKTLKKDEKMVKIFRKKKSVTDEKKNYRTNGNEWIRCVKIIECVNLWCKLLIFCSLYLSILSVNDAKTRLKKASRMSLFYLLSYYDTDKSEINIESIFKNCREIPLCNLYISWIVYTIFFKKVN